MDKENLMIIAIVTLFVSLFIGLTYPKVAESYRDGKVALKTAAANDIALIIDAMYASPHYGVSIVYDYNLDDFVIEISQNKVKIYSASSVKVDNGVIQGNDPTPAEHSFVPVHDNPEFILDRPENIIFQKINGRLDIPGAVQTTPP
jgi:hypothetical protein